MNATRSAFDIDSAFAMCDWSGGNDRPPWAKVLREACYEILLLRALLAASKCQEREA